MHVYFNRIILATVFILSLMVIISCETTNNPSAPEGIAGKDGGGSLYKNPFIHHVSVGGADICEALGLPPGCDANFSLVAKMKEDGSVSGQWQDSFGNGEGGFHATITCLSVNGNEAWVSGVITSGNAGDTDLTDLPVIARILDNGNSGDKISFSFINDPNDPTSCLDEPDLTLFELAHGQVKVR